MSNVLAARNDSRILALGRLGWSLRRIEQPPGSARNGQRLLESRWPWGAGPRPSPQPPGKTGHFVGGVHRLARRTAGHHGDGVHRPHDPAAPQPGTKRKCVRAVPRPDRRGAGPGAQRHGHLAGPGSMTMASLPVMRASGASSPGCGTSRPSGPCRHYDRPRRGSAGRLQRRADGARQRHRQASAHPALRAHAGLLPQGRPVPRLAVERPGLGRAPRAGLPRLGGTVRVVVLDNLKEGVLTPTSTTRRSIRSIATSSRTTPRSRCRAGSAIPIGKQSRSRGRPCEEDAASAGYASSDSPRRRPISIAGRDALGRHAHPRHHQAAGRRHVCRGTAGLGPLPLEPFRYYQYGQRTVHLDGCVEVAAPTMARRQGGLAGASTSSGTPRRSGLKIDMAPSKTKAA